MENKDLSICHSKSLNGNNAWAISELDENHGWLIHEIHITPGQKVEQDQPIISIRSEDSSITLNVLAHRSGRVEDVLAKADASIGSGDEILCVTDLESDTGTLPEPGNKVRFSDDVMLEIRSGPFPKGGEQRVDARNVKTRNIWLALDAKGNPKKIGDGTYGLVLEGYDHGDHYAVKVLHNRDYDKDNGTTATLPIDKTTAYAKLGMRRAKERFEDEATALYEIKDKLHTNTRAAVASTIVDHAGWTTEFPIDRFKNCWSEQGLSPSTYALVTHLYEGTLKDLLEEQNPRQDGKTGYDILRGLAYPERMSTILPFVEAIASGLELMHDADYVHLDIKPANIFWRKEDGGKRLGVAIGDLGYIRKKTEIPEIASDADAALGTLRYRSPEQKNFKDGCEVRIETGKDGNTQLITRDPKFKDTIIEKGDFLKMFKDWKETYRVLDVKVGEPVDWETTILIETKEPLPEDPRTQILMYKNQGERTDLFGFGAVLYDLITCGKSPEGFYDYLMVYDKPSVKREDKEEITVDTIVNQYNNLPPFAGSDSEYLGIFEAFIDETTGDRMPAEIVSLILKCMLYRTKGTFYSDWKMRGGRPPFEEIQSLLREFRKELNKEGYPPTEHPDENRLTGFAGPSDGTEDRRARRKTFRDEVNKIQKLCSHGCTNLAELGERFGWAALRYFQLFKLVKNYLFEHDPDFSKSVVGQSYSFSELSPETIAFNKEEPVINARVYKQLKEYLSDLREDRIGRIRMRYQPVNPFSPPDEMAYTRRRIELGTVNAIKSQSQIFEYRFIDSSPLGDDVCEGDWIVVTSGKRLLRIADVLEKHCIKVTEVMNDDEMVKGNLTNKSQPKRNGIEGSLEGPQTDSTSAENGSKEALKNEHIYIRNLDRNSYYLGVLGAYAYQLFFVGIGGNTVSEPVSVQSLKAQLRATPSLVDKLFHTLQSVLEGSEDLVSGNRVGIFNSVYERLTAFYLMLWVPEFRVRYLDERVAKPYGGLNKLISYWEKIAKSVVELLDLPSTFFIDDYVTATKSLKHGIDEFRKQNFSEIEGIKLSIGEHLKNLMRQANEMDPVN